MATRVQSQLATVRSNRGVGIADLAGRVGVTRQTIYAIEAGTYVPNTEVALRLARELEVGVEDLFNLEGQTPEDSTLVRAEVLSAGKPAKGQAVRACRVGSKWVGIPVSATPYHLPEADGVMASAERIALFSQRDASEKRLVLAGCDPAAGLLARSAERIGGVEIVHAAASSQLALKWLKEGKVHVAGSHLEDPQTAEFNLPFIRKQFPNQDMAVVTFAEWEEGFVIAAGNPKSIRKVDDLARTNVRFVNREVGSGSRGLMDKLLRESKISRGQVLGYDRVALGHLVAAYTVGSGDADCCLATRAAARAYGLDFIPVRTERYDFVMRRDTLGLPAAQAFVDALQRAVLRRKLETLAGYDTSNTGKLLA